MLISSLSYFISLQLAGAYSLGLDSSGITPPEWLFRPLETMPLYMCGVLYNLQSTLTCAISLELYNLEADRTGVIIPILQIKVSREKRLRSQGCRTVKLGVISLLQAQHFLHCALSDL